MINNVPYCNSSRDKIMLIAFWLFDVVCYHIFCLTYISDDLRAEQDRNKMLQEDMEATLQDIQNIWIGTWEGKVQGHFWWIGSNFRRDVWLLNYLSTISSHNMYFQFIFTINYSSTLDIVQIYRLLSVPSIFFIWNSQQILLWYHIDMITNNSNYKNNLIFDNIMKKLKWIHHSSRPWVTVVADDTIKQRLKIILDLYPMQRNTHTYHKERFLVTIWSSLYNSR